MRYSLADLSEQMFNRPVAISMHKAQIILGVLGPRLNVGSLVIAGEDRARPIAELSALAAQAAVDLEPMPGDRDMAARDWETGAVLDPYEIWNDVAILKVRGTLMPEGGLNPSSGMTSYAGLAYKARYAAADDRVKGIILDHDSGGGAVTDMLELCAQLREIAAVKPMRSIVRGMSASADYAIACCGQEVTCAPYSWVGSIGALIAHADYSEANKQDGIAVTLITSAPHKADADQDFPLAPDVRDRLQAEVDLCAQAFITHVAEARGISVDEITAQEARFYNGLDAQRLGLVDKIMPWDASMKEFAQSLSGGGNRTVSLAPGARPLQETIMSNELPAPAASTQPELTQADIDKLRTDAATAERNRITALTELAGGEHHEALTAAIADGSSPGAFAIALNKLQREQATAALSGAQADAVAPELLPAKAAQPAPGAKVNRGAAYAEKKAAAQKR